MTPADIKRLIHLIRNPPVEPGPWHPDRPTYFESVRFVRREMTPNTLYDDPYDVRWMGDDVSPQTIIDQLAKIGGLVTATCSMTQFRALRDARLLMEFRRPDTQEAAFLHIERAGFEVSNYCHGMVNVEGHDRPVDVFGQFDDNERKLLTSLGAIAE